MTKDRYYTMCDQMGKEPVESEIPPDTDDFPEVVQHALNIFNLLGDRTYPEIGYVGKDYTNLKTLINIYGVSTSSLELFIELLHWLDARAIKKSSEELKKEYDKLKRKK